MKYKLERIKKILQNEIMKIITNKEVKDPRIPEFLTITRLTISKDLHYCHIYFTMLDTQNKSRAEAGLNNAAGFFQKLLAGRVSLKFTPKLTFKYDEIEEEANKIDQLLNNLASESN